MRDVGWALQFASSELRGDGEIVLWATTQSGGALHYASSDLQKDKAVALAAVTDDGWALQYASSELRDDKEVVMAAIAPRTSWVLQFASSRLRGDGEIIKAAAARDVQTLRYASPELRRVSVRRHARHVSLQVRRINRKYNSRLPEAVLDEVIEMCGFDLASWVLRDSRK